MSTFRIALANLRFPATPEESVTAAEDAIAQASAKRADILCFPECFIPGYRGMGKSVPPPDPVFLERAWSAVAGAAAKSDLAVILGTERSVPTTSAVVRPDGTLLSYQPYGQRGLLIADIDISEATGLLAARCKSF
jgi:predicted amidohydrolase